jgi:hypothetical protein
MRWWLAASWMADLHALLMQVLDRHADADKWAAAPFEKIRRIPNTKVGDAGQDYVEALCQLYGLSCRFPEDGKGKRSKQSPWDIEIGGIRFELKTATEDVSNSFQFNHVRYARDYQALLCLGIGPDAVWFNLWSKADVATGKAGRLVSMEKSGSASYKLTKRKADLLPIDQFQSVVGAFVNDFQP